MSDDFASKELEDYKSYRAVFFGTVLGQRVLADLLESFSYNRITSPYSEMDMVKLEGSRDVIRHIFFKLGLGEQSQRFVEALALVKTEFKPIGYKIETEEED